MISTFSKIFIFALAAIAAGCATLGGGQTLPGIIPGVLVNDAGILKNQAETGCNGTAAQQYRRAMVICSNAQTFVAGLPGNPFVTPAQEAQVIEAQCATDGFVPPMPAAIEVGNCPKGVETPAS